VQACAVAALVAMPLSAPCIFIPSVM
jgi:hypothetical protein